MRNEKLHTVALSDFASQNVQKHTNLSLFLEGGMWKNGTPPWHECIKLHLAVVRSRFHSQNAKKHEGLRPVLEGEMSKNADGWTDRIG